MSDHAIVLQEPTRALAQQSGIRDAFEIMAYGLSEGSRRQYRHTFDRWRAWCIETGVHPADLSAANVIRFLDSHDLARKTRMAQLTHLRRLAQTLHTSDVSNAALRQNY